MKISDRGLAMLKAFEGCKLTAYQDSVGIWTTGYGHTSMAGEPVVKRGLKITHKEAEAILKRDLLKYEKAVIDALKHGPTQNQFDAMVSLCFNIGPKAFAGSSVVKKFNAGDKAGAADAFLKWNKARGRVLEGLTKRRTAEAALFRQSDKDSPAEPQSEPVAAKKPKPAQDVGAGAAAAGGASLAHYLGVSLEIIAGVLILAAIGWFIWRVWGK